MRPVPPFLRKNWSTLILVAIPFLLALPALRPGRVLYGIDAVAGYYHLHGAVGASIAQGRLPVWDPHAMGGAPLLAALHTAVLYPPTWIAAVLNPAWAWTLGMVLHLVLAGVFTEAWLRRGLGLRQESAFVGALLLEMSAFMIGHVHGGHLAHVSTVAWAPALLWRLERMLAAPSLRRGFLLAVVLALMILAGLPQFVFITGLAVAARLVHHILEAKEGRKARAKVAGAAAASMGLGLLLAAPQLLPTLELIGEGQRASITNSDFASSFSASPSTFLTLLAPYYFGDGVQVAYWGAGSIWESWGFVGLSGLGLALLGLLGKGKQRWFWAGVALVSVPLAMGSYTPIFQGFLHIVPGASLFRVPARYLFLFTLAAVPLAALGMERLLSGDADARRHALRLAIPAAVLVLVGGGFWLSSRSGTPVAEMSAGSLLWMAVCAAALGGVLVAFAKGVPAERCAVALALLLAGELWAHDSRHLFAQPTEDMEWPADFVANVRNNPQYPFRIATTTMQQTDAIGKCQLAGLDHVGGYDPMMLRRYTELVNVARGKAATDLIVAMVLSRPGPVFDLLGARYWIVPGPRQEPPGWRTIGELPSGFVYENGRALPRAFLIGRSVRIESAEERLRVLARPDFNAARVVVLENETAPEEGTDLPGGTVRMAAMEPGRYDLQVDAVADAWLVLSEAYYPGWSVEIDGHPAELLRADHLVQSVRVPAGRHDVRFRYQSRFLAVGFAVAILAALVPVGVLVHRRRQLALQRLPGAP